MYWKYFPFKKHAILIAGFLVISIFSFSQSSSCSCMNLFVNDNVHIASFKSVRIDNPNADGGRFFVAGPELGALNGNIGIGNPNPTKNSASPTTIWPGPLAKLHVNGATILGGNTLISSSLDNANKWLTIPAGSFGNWALWLDKGVVATNYAITQPDNWADYVFDSTYKLRSLQAVEKFIRENKHLPDVPSQQKIKSEGYTVHDINTRFLQKIEELTLYTIAQDKEIKALQQRLDELEKKTDKKNRKHR